MSDATNETLPHCEEWCEFPPDGDEHDETCPDHPLGGAPYTKREFVEQAELSASLAIEAYRAWRDDEDYDHAEALEAALAEVEEGAICYAGIGSCGRGWCQHA